MSQKPNHLRIGLFVLGAIALVLLGLFAFGLRKRLERRHHLLTYVPGDVEGLSIGSPVKLKGVTVGEVTGLYFSWNRYPGTKTPCVIVEFEIRQGVSPVPVLRASDFDPNVTRAAEYGLRVIVKSQGITGASFLELEILDPAKNPPFAYDWAKPRYPYIPAATSDLGRILGAVDRTLAKLEAIDTARIGAQLDRTLAAAEAAFRRIEQLDVPGLSKGANRTLESANATVAEIQGLAKDARGKVLEIPAEAIGADVRRVLAGLEATSAKLQLAVDRLSVIDVRELNDTLVELRLASRGLAEALATVRKQPSQLILGGAPPPAGSVEKEERK